MVLNLIEKMNQIALKAKNRVKRGGHTIAVEIVMVINFISRQRKITPSTLFLSKLKHL
jgi:hypothetical protein